MRNISLLLLFISIACILLTPSPSSAEYNPTTGRFLQRDPLGTGPRVKFSGIESPFFVGTTGPRVPEPAYIVSRPIVQYSNSPSRLVRVNKTNPVGRTVPGKLMPVSNNQNKKNLEIQYPDGLNLYEYCKSSSLSYVDPLGLTACGIRVYRSAICTLTPKQQSDYGHQWLTDGTTTWDFPKNYFSDPIQTCHKFDKEHPMWIWDVHINYFGQGQLPDGTPCGQATCSQIKDCLQQAENDWAGTGYEFFGHNCIDFTKNALMKCCLTRNIFARRFPLPFEEWKVCCQRKKEMERLGCTSKGGGP